MIYVHRFISTVGIDFREKKITWRGPKHENGEKLVNAYSIVSVHLIGNILKRDEVKGSSFNYGTQQVRNGSEV